jgi:tetratricopeptide (TPR) repeat protein
MLLSSVLFCASLLAPIERCHALHTSSQYLLGKLFFHEKEFSSAEKAFAAANFMPEAKALYWQMRCQELLGDMAAARQLRSALLLAHPNSYEAAIADFSIYTLQQYLNGDPLAIKHLETFVKNHPKSPLVLQALYLLSLDKRENQKNLFRSIGYLQRLEKTFFSLDKRKAIPIEQLNSYNELLLKAKLDLAETHIAIAKVADGAKRKIYLNYAVETLEKLLQENLPSQHPEDIHYLLANAAIALGNNKGAKEHLSYILKKDEEAKSTYGKQPFLAYNALASLAIMEKDHTQALTLLHLAEEAGKSGSASTNERLQLWINKSACLKELGNYDQAMLWLSKVVNDESISSLRIEAMFLRVDLYEREGRVDLAKKQLLSLAKQRGAFGAKAKNLLEKYYAQ